MIFELLAAAIGIVIGYLIATMRHRSLWPKRVSRAIGGALLEHAVREDDDVPCGAPVRIDIARGAYTYNGVTKRVVSITVKARREDEL